MYPLKNFFLSLFIATTISPEAKRWFATQKPTAAVRAELSKFPGLPPEYLQKAPGYFSSRVGRGLEMVFGRVLAGGRCTPQTIVEFLDSVTPGGSDNPAVKEFEAQVIHVQVLACLEGVNARQVAEAFVSEEFKEKGTDMVVSSKKTGNRVCQTTQVPMLGKSDYCYNEFAFEAPEGFYIHSYNDWNQDGVEVPIYFRQMLTATADIQINRRAGTAFYTDVYVRGVKISGLFRRAARSKILEAQKHSLEVLHSIATEK
jgi:hypothetical protein